MAPVSLFVKLSNISGFLNFVTKPFAILITFQLFWTLFMYNDYISFNNSFLFYPNMLFALVIFPMFHITRVKKEAFFAGIIQTYASTHALVSVLRGGAVAWIPTNAKQTSVSRAFKQATAIASAYVFAFLILIAVALRFGMLELFDLQYYSVQFWVIWNLALSTILLWTFYRTMEKVEEGKVRSGVLSSNGLQLWQFKTAGTYVAIVSTTFLGILYI